MTMTERIFAVVTTIGPDAVDLATRALRRSSVAHLGQFRRNGDPYVTHPIAVAATVAELGADIDTIAAALLQDLPSDTTTSLDDLRAEFGDPVVDLLDGFGRMDKLHTFDELDGFDRRILLLKVADRLHNMQTIDALATGTQRRKAEQTLQRVAPLARSLGLHTIAIELDSLAGGVLAATAAVPAGPAAARSTTGIRLSQTILHTAAALLLPTTCRERWLAEWNAELHTHRGARERLSFTANLLVGLPRMATQARTAHSETEENQ